MNNTSAADTYCYGTDICAYIIEMGFMTNLQEDRKLNSAEYEEKIVNGMTQGIINYFKNVAA